MEIVGIRNCRYFIILSVCTIIITSFYPVPKINPESLPRPRVLRNPPLEILPIPPSFPAFLFFSTLLKTQSAPSPAPLPINPNPPLSFPLLFEPRSSPMENRRFTLHPQTNPRHLQINRHLFPTPIFRDNIHRHQFILHPGFGGLYCLLPLPKVLDEKGLQDSRPAPL